MTEQEVLRRVKLAFDQQVLRGENNIFGEQCQIMIAGVIADGIDELVVVNTITGQWGVKEDGGIRVPNVTFH